MRSNRFLSLRRRIALTADITGRNAPIWKAVLGLLLAIALTPCLFAVPANAQATSTYVSGKGKDSNSCTATSPCLTLQRALAQTTAGGQIYSLDSANYGYVTINKAVSILAGRGATGVLATSSVSGLTIQAGPNDVITLQGLDIDGAGSGASGIQFTSGASLNIQDSVIRGFTNGINLQPGGASTLVVGRTLISNNSTGISLNGAAATTAILNDVQLVGNGTGLLAAGASSTASANVTLQNSIIANNSTVGIAAGAYSTVSVANSAVTTNTVGLQALAVTSQLLVSNSTVTGNKTAWQAASGAQVLSGGQNAFGGNTGGDTAPPPATAPPSAPTYIAKNIVTDFGATCDGVSDAAPAFMLFNSWAKVQTLPIMLTIPSGSVCNFASTPATFAAGVGNLVVSGYGARFTTTLPSFFLGGYGVVESNLSSALVSAVAAGASSVTLATPSQSSRFTVGRYALLTGGDLQGYGYPQNPWAFEYALVTSINAATGVITLSAPLQYTYKATWPSYNTGDNLHASLGGPATLYALDPSWNTVLEYRGLTISGNVQTYANGRSVKFTDVTFDGCTSSGGLSPTQNLSITLTNVTMLCLMEVDKLVSNFNIQGGNFSQLLFQSSSVSLFTMNNAAVTVLNGTPQQAVVANSSIGTLVPGGLSYGVTTEISCNTCQIGALKSPPGGVVDSNVDTQYTMSNGVITVPNSHGPVRWAVPGANAIFALYNGSLLTEGSPFQVLDITQDISNTYIKTSLTGGFPTLPTDPSTGLSIYAHPAPKFTCTSCTGSAAAIDISQAPAASPIFSHTNRAYTGNIGTIPDLTLWGNIVKITINVTTPYTGTQSALTLSPLGPYGTQIISGGVATSYNPTINLKIAGERDIFPTSVSGAQSGDSISVPGPIWFENTMQPSLSADISGELPSAWPSFTIQITTNQGAITP